MNDRTQPREPRPTDERIRMNEIAERVPYPTSHSLTVLYRVFGNCYGNGYESRSEHPMVRVLCCKATTGGVGTMTMGYI
jgi:hypothetical protein